MKAETISKLTFTFLPKLFNYTGKCPNFGHEKGGKYGEKKRANLFTLEGVGQGGGLYYFFTSLTCLTYPYSAY